MWPVIIPLIKLGLQDNIYFYRCFLNLIHYSSGILLMHTEGLILMQLEVGIRNRIVLLYGLHGRMLSEV